MVQRLRAAYVASGSSIGKLAQELGGILTAQGITEVFGERANPTSEQTLAILEYLESKSMATHLYEPKPDRPPRVQDPNNPLTLSAAKERIESLNQELARLKGSTSTLPIGNKQQAPAAAKPTAPAAPPAPTSSTAMIINPRPAPTSELERLRSQLEVAAPEQRASLYKQIKALENDTSMRAFKAARRK